MGTCIFCGQSAGWFKSEHEACREQRDDGLRRMKARARSAFDAGADIPAIAAEVAGLATSHRLHDERRGELIAAWNDGLRRLADDGTVDEDDERRLVAAMNGFHLTPADLGHGYERLGQALTLRDLKVGIVGRRFDAGGFNRVNLQRGEQVAWIFSGVDLVQEKVRRSTVGRSAGVSVRVMRGVYVRTGAFQGHQVEHTETITVDRGHAVFTDRHLYFAGGSKAWKMAWGKIVAMTPYADGLQVIKDGANAKPQTLMIADGLFAYNLAQGLSWLSEGGVEDEI